MRKGEFVQINGRLLLRLELDDTLAAEYPGATMYLVGQAEVIVSAGTRGIVVRGPGRPPTAEEVRAANEIFACEHKVWNLKGRGR